MVTAQLQRHVALRRCSTVEYQEVYPAARLNRLSNQFPLPAGRKVLLRGCCYFALNANVNRLRAAPSRESLSPIRDTLGNRTLHKRLAKRQRPWRSRTRLLGRPMQGREECVSPLFERQQIFAAIHDEAFAFEWVCYVKTVQRSRFLYPRPHTSRRNRSGLAR